MTSIFNNTCSRLLVSLIWCKWFGQQEIMFVITVVLALCISAACADDTIAPKNESESSVSSVPVGCVCGVFLSGQFVKGSKAQPTGNAALLHDQPESFPATPAGNRLCTNKCLESIVKYLPNSPKILCGAIDRDCYKERAHLFIKNGKDEWINTNLSAGREYCCKNGTSYKCPS